MLNFLKFLLNGTTTAIDSFPEPTPEQATQIEAWMKDRQDRGLPLESAARNATRDQTNLASEFEYNSGTQFVGSDFFGESALGSSGRTGGNAPRHPNRIGLPPRSRVLL
jgi:hypothetical protein